MALRDAIQELGAEIIGQELMDTYGGWPMYSKFFDNNVPLFHHLHLDNEAAARVGRLGKPEAYYFPPQLNNHLGEFPATYFGFDPDVKKEEVRACLECFEDRDNRITELSRAYRIELGTGWYTPAGETVHNQVSAIFNFACKYYRLPENPARICGAMGKKNADCMLFWTVDEFKRFIAAVSD